MNVYDRLVRRLQVDGSANRILFPTSAWRRPACPLPCDGSFIETFYLAWEVVIAFLDADAMVPKEVALPRPAARTVARYLADRREFPVIDVIEALRPLAQPELLRTDEDPAGILLSGGKSDVIETSAVLAPEARLL